MSKKKNQKAVKVPKAKAKEIKMKTAKLEEQVPVVDKYAHLDIEEVKRRLLNKFFVEEDDLKALSSEAEIREMFKICMASNKVLKHEDEGKEVADNYSLSKSEKESLAHYKKAKKVKVKAVRAAVEEMEEGMRQVEESAQKAEKAIQKAGFAEDHPKADLSHLTAEEQVSQDEINQALKDLGPLDF